MILNLQPNLRFADRCDGTGWDISAHYSGQQAQLQIGEISLAFDDRNQYQASGEGHYGAVIRLGELTDDPVRYRGKSVAGESAEHKLLFALAEQLGYSLLETE